MRSLIARWSLLFLVFAGAVFAQADETWQHLRPHFKAPAQFADDFGEFRSPLIFNDGSKVETAADWPKRRAEIFEQWQQLLGEWPPLITEPEVEVLKTEKREDFTQLTVRFLWTPGRIDDGLPLDSRGDRAR